MYPHFLQLIIRKQVGDLSTHTTKYTSTALTQKVFANIRRVGKGFSRLKTPLFEGMLVEQHGHEEGDAAEHVEEVDTGDAAEGEDSVAHGEVPTRVETSDDTMMDDESNQGRMIAEKDQDDAVALMDDKEVADAVKDVEKAKIDETCRRMKVVRVSTAPSRKRKGMVIRDPEEESTTSTIIPVETKSKDKGKWILVEEPKPLKKKQQIEQDEQYARELQAELNKDIDWDEAIDHVKRKAK
nr:hypothetical protein [Tanacetum cinerariifolium]